MCGIAGIFMRSGLVTPLDSAFLESMRHRGPDGDGLYSGEGVCLGHVRLSIIDLSERGAQPMRSRDGRYAITYNGEVYNYRELRSILKAKSVSFFSDSDTEVVLEAYRFWGADCVRHFRGMFAFAIWDAEKRELFMARDRCGERPFYYALLDDRFVFASELKTLARFLPFRPELEPAAVDMYLHYQYTPEPLTLLKGVNKLPAGHTMLLSSRGDAAWKAEPGQYWDVTSAAEDAGAGLPHDQPGILSAIRDKLEESVKLCLRADVPVGVALSGGIDSGAIAALAQKHSTEPLHAFAVGYPGRPPCDEREQARALAEKLGMIFHEVEIPVDDFVRFFPTLASVLDEPVGDIAAFGHFAVPQAAHEHGLKVLLTGIGGDEVFWGYDWTRQSASLNAELAARPFSPLTLSLFRHEKLRRLPRGLARASWLPGSLRRRAGFLNLALPHVPEGYPYFMTLTPDFRGTLKHLPRIMGEALQTLPPETPFLPQAMDALPAEDVPAGVIGLLFRTWLTSNCLTLGDRVSMSMSVESRLPFLDGELIGLVMALRRQCPDHELGQKAWLRAALKGVLPDEVLTRPKAGFTPPVHEWGVGVVREHGAGLCDGELQRNGYVRRDALLPVMETLDAQDWQMQFLLYKMTLLETWFKCVQNWWEK